MSLFIHLSRGWVGFFTYTYKPPFFFKCHGCTRDMSVTNLYVTYVPKTQGMPYLCMSFSAKEPYNEWLFCGKKLIWLCHFLQKSHVMSGSFAKRNLFDMWRIYTWHVYGTYWYVTCILIYIYTSRSYAWHTYLYTYTHLVTMRDIYTYIHIHIT